MKMEVPGFYFCICPDALLSKRHIEALLSSFPLEWQGKVDRYTFWADDLKASPTSLSGDMSSASGNISAHKIWDTFTMASLSETPRLIFIRSAQSILAADWKKFSAILATPRSNILPVFFMEGTWEKGQSKIPSHITKLKCFEFAKKREWKYENIGITEQNLSKYVLEEAKKQNLNLSKEVLTTLTQTVIPDALSIETLMTQLSLFLDAHTKNEHTLEESSEKSAQITPQILSQVTKYAPEMLIFDLIRDMENGQTQKIWDRLSRESDKGESFLFPLISLLARDARILWQLLAGENPYVAPFIKDAKMRHAKRLGFSGISKIFDIVLEADFSIKSGKNDILQALEKVIIEYTCLYSK